MRENPGDDTAMEIFIINMYFQKAGVYLDLLSAFIKVYLFKVC